MNKRVLITGGAGFIGSNLALKLLNRDYIVTVLDNLSPQIHGDDQLSPLYLSIKDKVNFIKGDVCNQNDWLKALDKQDIVVHLAAETGTGQSMYEIKRYVDVNIGGTALMLDIIANHRTDIKKMIIASSRAIYGEGKYLCEEHSYVYPEHRKDEDMKNGDFNVKCPHCGVNVQLHATDEQSDIHPSSIYGITKQNQEQMVLMIGKSLNIPAVAFRYQNVYGPGQSLKNPYTGILSIFSTRIKNNNEITIFEDGKESRDFVYIDDVVNATISGIENENADYEVFNVGTGIPVSVMTVAQTLNEKYNGKVNIQVTGNYRLGDIRHNFADITKIKKLLGFKPEYNFERGIGLFTDWVNTQAVGEDLFERSINEMKEKGLYK